MLLNTIINGVNDVKLQIQVRDDGTPELAARLVGMKKSGSIPTAGITVNDVIGMAKAMLTAVKAVKEGTPLTSSNRWRSEYYTGRGRNSRPMVFFETTDLEPGLVTFAGPAKINGSTFNFQLKPSDELVAQLEGIITEAERLKRLGYEAAVDFSTGVETATNMVVESLQAEDEEVDDDRKKLIERLVNDAFHRPGWPRTTVYLRDAPERLGEHVTALAEQADEAVREAEAQLKAAVEAKDRIASKVALAARIGEVLVDHARSRAAKSDEARDALGRSRYSV